MDLCNHRATKDPEEQDIKPFMLLFSKGYAKIGIRSQFQPEEEYSYTYLPQASNERLLRNYGFYIDNNPLSTCGFETSFHKTLFTKEKYEICKKINCIDKNIDSIYMNRQFTHIPIDVTFFPHKINERYLNSIRIYVEPITNFNASFIFKSLKKKRWISYNNEMTSLVLYLFSVKKFDETSKLNSVRKNLNLVWDSEFYSINEEFLQRKQGGNHQESVFKIQIQIEKENYQCSQRK